ncbi:helix-turn-helix transcriptional regulator [Hymenobacter lutimineralis]|uniref:Helix-turn-helix transcriptional regulator n=1 Tax=Hymenobacter lutimineralis TaxID=2606448 RepID=A0A5D6V7C7_9BACT|nr:MULTISPECIES: helix-turn-helix transcriptional regulator [Hymenobacter]QIX63081.1 helix-turn-helix transcriptional regulator [Hymenobacter sp. BT18]TYZ10574.1 helix-turn-helix transcriptional regulator [Hymenobacter lutimineralis]
MARPAAFSDSRLARVRRYFGLSQQELAALLGLAPSTTNQLERGTRALTREVYERLAPFLAILEAAEAAPAAPAPAAPDPETVPEAPAALTTPPPGPFAPGPLERRRRTCLYEAHNMRWQLRHLPEQAAVAARWAAALPRLRATLPPPPPAGAAPRTPEEVRLRYVHSWLETVPLALEPEVLAHWHLRHQRALALEAEAAALGGLLAGATG